MKKYLVIGNPIEHSLSPKLHNYWIKKNNIDAVYEKKQIDKNDIRSIIEEIRNGDIHGINVTIPYKKSIIPYIDELSFEAKKTKSVNTIYKVKDKIVGHNTDVGGFELAIKHINYDVKNKKIFLLGAGGVSPSIIFALQKMKATKIILSNRTKKKAENLKKIFSDIEIVDGGKTTEFNMIINATSLGLKKDDEIKLSYTDIGSNKLFYDIIYNPQETNFLKKAKQSGNQTENGKMMFIYQAHQAFTVWHKIMPEINDQIIKLLE